MHAIGREGLIAGVLGATSVAVWFFFIDLILQQPFATPYLLGRALLLRLGEPPAAGAEIAVVAGYTIFHFAAFIVVGMIAVAIVHGAVKEPSVLAGALILFVVFEVAFQALLSMFGSIPALGTIAWYNIAIGNLIAAVTMGTYIWRIHPELRAELAHALGGQEWGDRLEGARQDDADR
ncbi:MAG: hypothetical protein WD766_01320 [Gemmatimonadota bacterium]